MRPKLRKRGLEKAWLRGQARWLANKTLLGLRPARESPHDEILKRRQLRVARVVALAGSPVYLVRISLPSLVACKRYTDPLW